MNSPGKTRDPPLRWFLERAIDKRRCEEVGHGRSRGEAEEETGPRSGCVVQAYTFTLDPNAGSEVRLRSHCGAARKAFNWNLARVKANLAQREAERSYGTAEQDLTPALDWSAYSLRKAWNAAKNEVAPWWGECSKEAFATGTANLAAALANCHAGSPPGLSAWRTTGATSPCPDWAASAPTRTPANSTDAWPTGRRGSCPRPSLTDGAGGGWPSRSK